MDERRDEEQGVSKPEGVNRRRFIELMGAGAVAGAFLSGGGQHAKADDATVYWYQDSFGNVVPAVRARLI